MGWRTDWLYSLIFAEVARLWDVALEQGTTELFGPPPAYFILREHANADWSEPYCVGRVLREWRYSGTAFEECSPTDAACHVRQAQKAFYPSGAVQFHIRGDRKKVAFTYLLGPRYGRGMVFDVLGQGIRGRLEPDPDGSGWTS